MNEHDWALTLIVPLTDKEVRDLVDGGSLALSDPSVQVTPDVIACRVCDISFMVGADTACPHDGP